MRRAAHGRVPRLWRGQPAERLAHHALRGELWDKAVAYLRQAGLRAMARAANRAAIAHLEQALGALRGLPKTRETTELTIDLRIDLRNALLPLGDRARMGDLLHEAEALARTLGDQHRLARIATFMWIQCLTTGDYDDALRFGQEALSIARTLGDRSIEVPASSLQPPPQSRSRPDRSGTRSSSFSARPGSGARGSAPRSPASVGSAEAPAVRRAEAGGGGHRPRFSRRPRTAES